MICDIPDTILVTPGENTNAGWATDRAGDVGAGKFDAIACDGIDVRGGCGLIVKFPHVGVIEIIYENEDEICRAGGFIG